MPRSVSRLRFNAGAILLIVLSHAGGQAPAKIKVITEADLPRISYLVQDDLRPIFTGSPEAFLAFMQPVRADIDRILRDYDVQDHRTLRTLLQAKLDYDLISGRNSDEALALIGQIRTYEDKPGGKLVANLPEEMYLKARGSGGAATPAECPAGYEALYRDATMALPWALVRQDEIDQRGFLDMINDGFLAGIVDARVGPAVAKSHALSLTEAMHVLNFRKYRDITLLCKQRTLTVLAAYIQENQTAKPDIWQAREAVLPPASKLTPVNVAIWDSGFDTALFAGREWTNAHPGVADLHGIAFDVNAHPTHGDLIPLTAKQQADYPVLVKDLQAINDIENGINSDAAGAYKRKLGAMPPKDMRAYLDETEVISGYSHGTHVTGIAARGNPAIRLAYARMTYDNNNPHMPPSQQHSGDDAAMFAHTVDWFKANNIRVVNMSFWDYPANFERDLEANGIGKDAAERKQLARQYFNIEKAGMYNAIKNAPGILFVTIAGNSDSDNAFEETMPSSFVLPNLIVAGAVDMAGDETSFTSYGKNVLVDADGYQVQSVVPGGQKVAESGTSMAAPQVTNLAAKLLAIDPSLTPVQLIALICKGADTTSDGRRHLINPAKSVSLLASQKNMAAK